MLHGKNNVYTRFFRWESKLCLYIVFSAPPEMRHCSSLRAPFLMYSLLFPHVTAVAVLCVRIEGGCGTTWRPKPKSNTNKKNVFKHLFHTTPKTQYPLSCRRWCFRNLVLTVRGRVYAPLEFEEKLHTSSTPFSPPVLPNFNIGCLPINRNMFFFNR